MECMEKALEMQGNLWSAACEPCGMLLVNRKKYTWTILAEMVCGKGLGNLCSLRFVACDVSKPSRMLLVNLSLISVFFWFFFAKHLIAGLLFKNIHPSLQYSSRSRIHTSL